MKKFWKTDGGKSRGSLTKPFCKSPRQPQSYFTFIGDNFHIPKAAKNVIHKQTVH